MRIKFCPTFLLFFSTSALAEQQFKIVATTSLVADLVRHVAVGHEVKSLMGAGVDPHLYKATQGDLKTLLTADLIFYSGLHLEGKMAETLEHLSKKQKVYSVAADLDQKLLRHPSDFQGNPDPHVWFDVKLRTQALLKIKNVMKEFDPANAASYELNAAKYLAELSDLDTWITKEIALIPKEQRVLITAHDAFGYFGKAYDIEVLGLQGISTASEFGSHDVSRLVDLIVNRKIKAVFVESSVPQKYVLALKEGVLAKGGKVEIGGELFSDALGAENSVEGSYIGMFRYNVNVIVKALK